MSHRFFKLYMLDSEMRLKAISEQHHGRNYTHRTMIIWDRSYTYRKAFMSSFDGNRVCIGKGSLRARLRSRLAKGFVGTKFVYKMLHKSSLHGL